jgi:hypothetical protein
MDEASAVFAARIFPATGINAGSSALPKDQLFKRMTRSEFVTYIRDTTVSAARRHGVLALPTVLVRCCTLPLCNAYSSVCALSHVSCWTAAYYLHNTS